jgi:hypothetical protein
MYGMKPRPGNKPGGKGWLPLAAPWVASEECALVFRAALADTLAAFTSCCFALVILACCLADLLQQSITGQNFGPSMHAISIISNVQGKIN